MVRLHCEFLYCPSLNLPVGKPCSEQNRGLREVRGRLGIPGIPHFMLTGTSVSVSHADLVVPRDLHVTRLPDAPSQLLTVAYARRTPDAFGIPTCVMSMGPASVPLTLHYSQPCSQLNSFMSCCINGMKTFLLKNVFLSSLNWTFLLSCADFFVSFPHFEGNQHLMMTS